MKGGGNRGLEGHPFSAEGMIESEEMRVEREAFVIADFATVFTIADDGPALVRQMHPDLVFAPGEEGNLDETAFPDLLDHLVAGLGPLPLAVIGRGINPAGFILREVTLDEPLGRHGVTFDKGEIGLFGLLPIALQGLLRFFGPRKDEGPGGIAVETVDDKDSFPGFVVPLFDVVIEGGVRGAPAIAPRSHREQARRLVHHDDVAILVENFHSHRLMFSARALFFLPGHAPDSSGLA